MLLFPLSHLTNKPQIAIETSKKKLDPKCLGGLQDST